MFFLHSDVRDDVITCVVKLRTRKRTLTLPPTLIAPVTDVNCCSDLIIGHSSVVVVHAGISYVKMCLSYVRTTRQMPSHISESAATFSFVDAGGY